MIQHGGQGLGVGGTERGGKRFRERKSPQQTSKHVHEAEEEEGKEVLGIRVPCLPTEYTPVR